MRTKKVLSALETQQTIEKLKSGITVNALRQETGYGVNILYRIIKENNLPYIRSNSHKGRITEAFEEIFSANSKSGNRVVVQCIKQHNLIPHDKCYNCGLGDWLNGALVLELDHINGNNLDHRLVNLRFLCPNCHSQTPTYKGRNINKGNKKISDEQLTKALKEEKNIRKALMKVGLSPKGGNYERAYKLLNIS